MKKVALLACSLLTLTTSVYAGAQFGADRHVAKGVTCESCHGKGMAVEYPSIEQCTTCHNPDQVEKATAKAGQQNPHRSPHYGNTMDCVLCHTQHSETQDGCGSCHDFKFQVP